MVGIDDPIFLACGSMIFREIREQIINVVPLHKCTYKLRISHREEPARFIYGPDSNLSYDAHTHKVYLTERRVGPFKLRSGC